MSIGPRHRGWRLLCVALCVLAGAAACESYGEKTEKRVAKAAQSGHDPAETVSLVAKALWRKGTYSHEIQVEAHGDGYRVNVVATRKDDKTVIGGTGSLKDYELRTHAKRIWRVYRAPMSAKVSEIVVTVRLPVTNEDGSKETVVFLKASCTAQQMAALAGHDTLDPYDIKGGYDDLRPKSDKFVRRLVRGMSLLVDASDEIYIE